MNQQNHKKVLITGGAGFIGSHTAEEFLAHGYEVTVLDNLRTGDLENIRHVLDKITFVEGDILDKAALERVIDADTRVVNLAALISVTESVDKPSLVHETNVSGAELVMTVVREKGATCFVSASSAAVYGDNAEMPLTEESSTVPISPYGLHKYVNELYGRTYSRLYNFPSVFLRFFNVYGPRQKFQGGYPSVIPAFIKKILAGEPATIFGSGDTVRDYVYVKDIARALRMAVEHAAAQSETGKKNYFDVFNIATGKPTTLDQLWQTMCAIRGLNMKVQYGPSRPGDVFASYATGDKAREVLGYEAKVGIEDGLRALFASLSAE